VGDSVGQLGAEGFHLGAEIAQRGLRLNKNTAIKAIPNSEQERKSSF
jgi:hypothetical protein